MCQICQRIVVKKTADGGGLGVKNRENLAWSSLRDQKSSSLVSIG